MPPDRRFVETTLADIEEAVRFLRGLATRSQDEFTGDLGACYASAYALIMAIEGTCGVASHLVATCNLPSPKGMAEAFEVLHRSGIIKDAELREHLAAMATFRNLLVHRYWRVDYGRVYTILQEHLDDFGAFAREVERFLGDQGL